jgi:hypothetical protein
LKPTRQEWLWAVVDPSSRLTAMQVTVALALSVYMKHNEPSCWPAIETLATGLRRAESTVRDAIRGLERAGFLTVRANIGRGNTNQYVAALPGPEKHRSGRTKAPEEVQKTPAHRPRSRRSLQTVRGDLMVAPPAVMVAPPAEQAERSAGRPVRLEERRELLRTVDHSLLVGDAEVAADGCCDDCGRVGTRWRHQTLRLCRRCVSARRAVSAGEAS